MPPPSILVDVLKHGGKYVPFPTLHPFVARSSKMLRKEVDELERVLIWFYTLCFQENIRHIEAS